ncbi:MAG: chloride channel protein [Candidatus Heimdallarchaeaceae archaeon]
MKQEGNEKKKVSNFVSKLKVQFRKYLIYSTKWFPFAILIGLISGVVMGLFTSVVVNLQRVSRDIPVYYRYPIIGIVTSLFLYFGFKEVRGAGISFVLKHKNSTKPIPPRSIITKFISSFITLGLGAPAGREGPSATIGSSIAFTVADKTKMTKEDEMHAITIGAAACTAAVFRAPFGGTVFAAEVPYKRDLDETVFLPALVASAISLLVSESILTLLNSHPVHIDIEYISPSLSFVNALGFVLLGLFAGIIGVMFSLIFKSLAKLFERYFKIFLLPLLGMLITTALVFLIGLALPEGISLEGNGFESINFLLENYSSISIKVIIFFLIGKVLVTSTCVGLGASGGVMGPSLATGAALGFLYSQLFPGLNQLTIIIVGMSSMHTATTKTPIASMILVLEMVGFPNIIIPLILSNAMAFIISMDFSLYSGQIQSKEVILRRRIQYTDILETLRVSEAMEEEFPTVKKDSLLQDSFSLLYLYKTSALVVVDKNEKLAGIISARDFQNGFSRKLKYVEEAMTKNVIVAFPDESLSKVFDRLTSNAIEGMPVVSRKDQKSILGYIAFNDIENRYETAITKLQSKRNITIEELENEEITDGF